MQYAAGFYTDSVLKFHIYFIRFEKNESFTMETKKDLRYTTYKMKVTAVSQEYKSYWLSKLKNSESNYTYICDYKKPRSLDKLGSYHLIYLSALSLCI